MTIPARVLPLLALASLAGPAALGAQSLWLDPARDGGFYLEFLRPDIEGYSPASGAFHFGLRAPITRGLALVGELPAAHGDLRLESGGVEFNGQAVAPGNPYLGVEIDLPGGAFHVELGGRVSIVDSVDSATSIGFLADPVDRPEAFLPGVASGTLRVHGRWIDARGLGGLLHGGVTGWLPVDGGESELHATYGARLVRLGPDWTAMAGVTGRANLSAEGRDLEERTLHQFGAAVSLALGPLRPGAELRVPLDENLREAMDWVLGLTLQLETGR